MSFLSAGYSSLGTSARGFDGAETGTTVSAWQWQPRGGALSATIVSLKQRGFACAFGEAPNTRTEVHHE